MIGRFGSISRMKEIKGNAIDFGHVKIDDDDIALMMLEPGGSLETFGKVFAGVAFLLEIGREEFSDCRVIIDEEELSCVPVQ